MNHEFESSIIFKILDETEQEKISGGITSGSIKYPVIVRFAISNASEAQTGESPGKRGSKVRIM